MTLPNALCAARLAGAAVLCVLAWFEAGGAFFWLLVVMLFSDWLDGKLARWLDQRSAIGPILDSVADMCTYAAIALGLWWLRPDALRHEMYFVIAAAVGYLLHVGIAFGRFRRWPSYHTRAAKTCWLLIGVGALVLFAGGPSWPLRIGLIMVVIANVEAIAITFTLPAYRDDIPSILHAARRPPSDSGRG